MRHTSFKSEKCPVASRTMLDEPMRKKERKKDLVRLQSRLAVSEPGTHLLAAAITQYLSRSQPHAQVLIQPQKRVGELERGAPRMRSRSTCRESQSRSRGIQSFIRYRACGPNHESGFAGILHIESDSFSSLSRVLKICEETEYSG